MSQEEETPPESKPEQKQSVDYEPLGLSRERWGYISKMATTITAASALALTIYFDTETDHHAPSLPSPENTSHNSAPYNPHITVNNGEPTPTQPKIALNSPSSNPTRGSSSNTTRVSGNNLTVNN